MKKFFQKMGSTFRTVTATVASLVTSTAMLVPSSYAFAAGETTKWNQNASTIALGIVGVIFIGLLVVGAVKVAKGDDGKKLLIAAGVVFLIGGCILVAANFSTLAGVFQPVADSAANGAAGVGGVLLG